MKLKAVKNISIRSRVADRQRENALEFESIDEKKGELISTIDCTPNWYPLIKFSVQWIKDAKQFEKSYRKDCTDYDGAMQCHTDMILDCAKALDQYNEREKKRNKI